MSTSFHTTNIVLQRLIEAPSLHRVYAHKLNVFSISIARQRDCITFIRHSSISTSNVKPFTDIPGPKGLPFLGTLLQYKLGRQSIGDYKRILESRYEQYGPIVRENIAGAVTVHLFDPDDIQMVLNNEGKTPFIPPLLETTQRYRAESGLSLGLGNTNGEEWYRLRSAVQQMMMRPAAVTRYLPAVRQVADDFLSRLSRIRQTDNTIPGLANEISKWSVESAGVTCFDRRLGALDGQTDTQNLIDSSRLMFQLSTRLKYSLPLYKLLNTPTWRKLVAAEDIIYRTTMSYFNEAISRLAALQASTDERGDEVGDQLAFLRYLMSREELSQRDVAIVTLSLFTDGLSTTVPSLQSMLYCLARYPKQQQMVYEESLTDSQNYLRAFVKEAFRFFPIGPDTARLLQKDLVLSGYQVPAGTEVRLNNNILLRRPEFFPDPQIFNPARWLRGSPDFVNPHPYLHMPFGHGPRMCAGRRFAEQEILTIIPLILQHFRLEWTHSDDMDQRYQMLFVPSSDLHITFYDRSGSNE